MKQKIRNINPLLVIIFLLSGCTHEKHEVPNTTSLLVVPSITFPTEHEPSNEVSPYAEILEEYERLIDYRLLETFKTDWENGTYKEGDALKSAIPEDVELNRKWGYMLWDMTEGVDNATTRSFGYTCFDINHDGQPELLWLREDRTLLAIFTLGSGKPYLVDAFSARYEAVITNEGLLYSHSSGGAAFNNYELSTLSVDGKLITEQSFGTNGGSPQTRTLYYETINNIQVS